MIIVRKLPKDHQGRCGPEWRDSPQQKRQARPVETSGPREATSMMCEAVVCQKACMALASAPLARKTGGFLLLHSPDLSSVPAQAGRGSALLQNSHAHACPQPSSHRLQWACLSSLPPWLSEPGRIGTQWGPRILQCSGFLALSVSFPTKDGCLFLPFCLFLDSEGSDYHLASCLLSGRPAPAPLQAHSISSSA